MMISTLTYFHGIVAGMYMMACLVIAVVRWFHMCKPCDRNPDYFYPGRKAVTIIYLTSLFLIPYILFPETNGTWLLVKAYFLPMLLYFLAILLFSYFGSVMHWRKWRKPTLLLGAVAMLALFCGPVIGLLGRGGDLDAVKLGNYIILGLGVFMTGFCLFAVRVVRRWVARIDVEEYSNPEDFPVNFARKMVRLLMLAVALLWVAALSDNRTVMAILQMLLAGGSVGMLISALHPHRNGAPEEEEEAAREAASPQVYSYHLSRAKTRSIADAIRRVVEEDQAFLDPHLSMQDVATRCGFNRTYVAGIFKTEFGGFFHYVNVLRLKYADDYRTAHPASSISELADAAGFGSRQTYYKVKKALEQ